MKRLFERAGISANWTTYELRHSFVTLAKESLGDLQAVADTVGASALVLLRVTRTTYVHC